MCRSFSKGRMQMVNEQKALISEPILEFESDLQFTAEAYEKKGTLTLLRISIEEI